MNDNIMNIINEKISQNIKTAEALIFNICPKCGDSLDYDNRYSNSKYTCNSECDFEISSILRTRMIENRAEYKRYK